MNNLQEKINNLNSSQQEAISKIDGALLILAGAGSGKTTTITTRLAYMISLGIDPSNTLTLTFTNKAASEMRLRTLALLDNINQPPLLCTFHKFGIFFLKMHISRLNRDNSFIVIDKSDKKKVIKNLNSSLEIPSIDNYISNYKNSAIGVQEAIKMAKTTREKAMSKAYEAYEDYLLKNNLVDFDDLLLLTYNILSNNQDLKEEMSQKYNYITVDEFQDTNKLQMKILELLCSHHNNICVVGDDDQSIYSWRGADIKNILGFKDIFKNTQIVKLTTNYRSTPSILKLSNMLIQNNTNRFDKVLTSSKEDGQKPEIWYSPNEKEEALKIAKKTKSLISSNTSASEIAVLFRTHAISRAIEESFHKLNIDYKIIGGIKFYERAEIKDIIAYIRVALNQDDFSLLRIINTPKRGLGKVTINKIQEYAQDTNIFNFLQSCSTEELNNIVGIKNAKSLQSFISNIQALSSIALNDAQNFITSFEERFELKDYYAKKVDGYEKVANINEFYEYFNDAMEKEDNVVEFLNDITMQSDSDNIDGECVYLMSIHASKGLEFECVFLAGLEDGVFPIIADDVDIEEERRLAYVAITRAKEKLFLSSCKSRFYKGRYKQLTKSIFLSQMLNENTQTIKSSMAFSSPVSTSFKKGDVVKHKVFGMGKIIDIKNMSSQQKLTISFGSTKRDLLSNYVEKI